MTAKELRDGQREAHRRAARTVFVPREFRGQFRTLDNERYRRDASGVIHRVTPKVRGKAARRAEKAARRRAA